MNHALHNSFKYPVEKLLEAIKKNREEHLKNYTEAMGNYRRLVKEELESLLKIAQEGMDIRHTIGLRRPESHLKEYDQAITMLGMTSDKTIEIDGHTFAKLVMDEWEWKSSFTTNTMSYTNASLRAPGAYSNVKL